jgi:hypothetical protein
MNVTSIALRGLFLQVPAHLGIAGADAVCNQGPVALQKGALREAWVDW